ncbi:helix-turn-helix domain-containing protein [Polaromonas sp. YR568]|uniref:helix-turn-helix domain-containing protein n=1 Tax=Polaromonas sp. YR568 TaxID=1855301 RepID=UPI0031381A7A
MLAHNRLAQIGQARQTLLYGDRPAHALSASVDGWIERSWQRCLSQGHRPDRAPVFNQVSVPLLRRTLEENHQLVQAARPVLQRLGRAIEDTRYFAILTNHRGVVIDVNGPIDRSDRRADLLTRIGTDLSEQEVGTTAIGAALTELQPVWLHRGEHFFEATSDYSCAGAPLFAPDGRCMGMLDLTGIEVAERPELKHLVSQSARSIENALLLGQPHALMVRLSWPGRTLGDESDGLLCLDADGCITGANQIARELLPSLAAFSTRMPHCSELFALPFEMLFDAARRSQVSARVVEVPLWSGLRLQALPLLPGQTAPTLAARLPQPALPAQPLKELETALIRKAVDDARGNVVQAARALGVSRATVYRRLNPAKRRAG